MARSGPRARRPCGSGPEVPGVLSERDGYWSWLSPSAIGLGRTSQGTEPGPAQRRTPTTTTQVHRAMRIEIRDLLASVPAIGTQGMPVGLPDGPTWVEVALPDRFAASLDAAIRAFQLLRPGTRTLVSAEVNTYRKAVVVRVLQNGRSDRDRGGRVKAPLARSFDQLRSVVQRDGGSLDYWGGNNYLDVLIPYPNPDRDDFPEVEHLAWNDRYRVLLERESWSSLRDRAFRFSDLASRLAARCVARRMKCVLVPSVGICVHPWLFASRALNVAATDSAGVALAALSKPGLGPNLYSTAAYERWDISECATFAMMPHPGHFDGMPALEDDRVREVLRQRIVFLTAEWVRLPVASPTVDLVFATNAVPRSSDVEREAVLGEWVRVLRPGGVVFIVQHNPGADRRAESFLSERGLSEIDFLEGDEPREGARGAFQVLYSSG